MHLPLTMEDPCAPPLPAWARPFGAVLLLCLVGTGAMAQTTYTNDIVNTSLAWGVPANWSPAGIPGFDVLSLSGNSNDNVVVNFTGTTADLDFAGSNYVFGIFEITEGAGNGNPDLLSTGGWTTQTFERLIYTNGNRQVDIYPEVTIADKADGKAFEILMTANILDFGGGLMGTEGIRIEGGQTFYITGYQMTYGTDPTNGMTFGGAPGGTKNFWIDASAGNVVHDIPNLTIENNGNVNIDFGRSSAGNNTVAVNISNLWLSPDTVTLNLGGGSNPDGSDSTTVNVLDQVDFSMATNTAGNKTVKIDSVYGGVVNFHSNIVMNQDQDGSAALLQYTGNGVARLLADPLQTNGAPLTLTNRIDGDRSLTVAVDAQSRLGAGVVDLRAGSVLRLDYDVFSNYVASGGTAGYPGSSLVLGAADQDVHFDFGTAQSGFFDPLTGATNAPFVVKSFTGIAGNLSGAVYTGALQNVIFQTNAILGENALNKPTYAELGGQYIWAGLRDAGGTYTNIGIVDGTNIFRGVAISALTPLGIGDLPNTSPNPEDETFLSGFHGTLTAASNLDLEVLLSGSVLFTPRTNGSSASFNADTGVANVRGPGTMIIQNRGGTGGSVPGLTGNVTNINRIGRGGIVSDVNPDGLNDQNEYVVDLVTANSLEQGDTLTVTDGQIRFRRQDVLGTGGTATRLNVGSGASLVFDNVSVTTLNAVLNRGKIVFLDDGAFYTGTTDDGADANTAQIAAMEFSRQSLFVLNDVGGSVTVANKFYNHIFTNMNIVWGDDALKTAIVQTASSFAIGDDRRLTGPGNSSVTNFSITDGLGNQFDLTAAAGASNVFITAGTGRSVTLFVNADMANAFQTTIGDSNSFITTFDNATTRTNTGQAGRVNIYGASNTFNNVQVLGGANLFLGSSPGDRNFVNGDLVVRDGVNSTTTLQIDGGTNIITGSLYMDSTTNKLPSGANSNPALNIRAPKTIIMGDLIVGSTNAGARGAADLDIGNDDSNSTEIYGSLIIDSPAKTSTSAHEIRFGDLVVSNNLVINASGIDYQTLDSANHGGSRLIVHSAYDTNETDGIGLLDRMRDNTLALGPDGILVRDFGALQIQLNRISGTTYDIGQKITISNTGPNYWFTDGRVLEFAATTNLNIPSGGSGTVTVNATNVFMTDGSYLRVNEPNSQVRIGLAVAGGLTNGVAHLSDSSSANNDAFDLLDVRSATPGIAKVVQIGTTEGRFNSVGGTNDLDDVPLLTSLLGVATSDITFDIVNGQLVDRVDLGGDVQGGVHVRAGQTFLVSGGAESILSLSGAGTAAASDITISASLSPGDSIGTLTITGDVMFLPSTVLSFELVGTNTAPGGGINDLLQLVGGGGSDIILDGTLDVDPVGTSFAGRGTNDFWTLITYTGLLSNNTLELGSLPTLDPGLAWTIDLSFDSEVRLAIVIPEPDAGALLLLGLAAVGWFVGRRKHPAVRG